MQQRVVGIRLVTGLIVAGGLLAGSLSPALAGPSQLAVDEVIARFEPCKPGKCKPDNPPPPREEPSKRGGKPKPEPPRGGNIKPPPPPPSPPNPPRGGRIIEPPPDDDDRGPRTVVTGGNSEPFVAQHQPIPDMSDGVFLTPRVVTQTAQPQSVVVVSNRVQPVVYAPPSAGVGPEGEAAVATASALAVLAALFGAGAVFTWRRPVGSDRLS